MNPAAALPGIAAALLLACAASAEPAEPAAPAERIVTLSPHLAELAYAAGAGDHLVGTVSWSDYPPAAARLPRIGDAFRLDLEALAMLSPDLVLAWKGGNPDALLKTLEAQGYRVVALAPQSLDEIGEQLARIGRLAGSPAVAEAAADSYRARLAALRAAQAGKRPVSVFYQVSRRPLYTVGGRQLISEIIALCGGRNIFAELKALAPAVGMEAVIARNPEVILTSDAQRGELAAWRRWPGIAAVERGNLFSVDGDQVARPSPRVLDGAAQVCAALDRARATAPPSP